ncbi:MAG: hypothetical protein ACOC9B_05290, partial [Chloroflexota bacterium]
FALVAEEEPVGAGDVQVITDIDFEENGWVYAATGVPDDGLWRWKVGTSGYWQQMDFDITSLGDGQEISGLVQGPEGTLYALRAEPVADDTGGMTRWLCPTCWPCADLEYDHVVEGLPVDASFAPAEEFTTTYPAGTLWSNEVETDLLAIDSAGQRIFLYRDTLCKRGPDLESPQDAAYLDANPCACNRDAVVVFEWEEINQVGEYEMEVYLDASRSEPLWSVCSNYEGIVISPGGGATDFLSGMRYGWEVRATEPVLSPWSMMRTFTATLCPVDDLVPASGSTRIAREPVFTWDCRSQVDGYEFTLATDPAYSDPVVSFDGADIIGDTSWSCDRQLESGSTYFWRVRPVRGDARGPWSEGQFTTEAAAVTPMPAADRVIEMPAQRSGSTPGSAAWLLFGLVVTLFVVLLVLVLRAAPRR